MCWQDKYKTSPPHCAKCSSPIILGCYVTDIMLEYFPVMTDANTPGG